ncbi:protein kinase family protein [Azotobacter armeniacus]
MNDFIAMEDRLLLERYGLANFDALWALQLPAIDEPNLERGGWSSVCRLALGETSYFLKRQTNHLTHTLAHPFGEPTFAHEFRNIRRYRTLGIPALQAAFFGMRRQAGKRRAILLTRALDGWRDLQSHLDDWPALDPSRRRAMLQAVGALVRRLHGAGRMHRCLYPNHIFLREADGACEACLIDLEKTRPLLLGRRDRIRDLDPLLRRASVWEAQELRQLLETYLGGTARLDSWFEWLSKRQRKKELVG